MMQHIGCVRWITSDGHSPPCTASCLCLTGWLLAIYRSHLCACQVRPSMLCILLIYWVTLNKGETWLLEWWSIMHFVLGRSFLCSWYIGWACHSIVLVASSALKPSSSFYNSKSNLLASSSSSSIGRPSPPCEKNEHIPYKTVHIHANVSSVPLQLKHCDYFVLCYFKTCSCLRQHCMCHKNKNNEFKIHGQLGNCSLSIGSPWYADTRSKVYMQRTVHICPFACVHSETHTSRHDMCTSPTTFNNAY